MTPSSCQQPIVLRLLFFSVLRDITGSAELRWELPAQSTLGDLQSALEQRWPQLVAWRPTMLMAVNCRYEKSGALLQDGAEVAFMPPVQGG
jgi:molybdopterin converting factor small subunit